VKRAGFGVCVWSVSVLKLHPSMGCVWVSMSLSLNRVCVSCSLMSFVMHVLSLSVLSGLGLCSVWVMSGVLSMNVSRVWCVSVRCRV